MSADLQIEPLSLRKLRLCEKAIELSAGTHGLPRKQVDRGEIIRANIELLKEHMKEMRDPERFARAQRTIDNLVMQL